MPRPNQSLGQFLLKSPWWSNAGNQFWGCSTYPVSKVTLKFSSLQT